MKSIAAANDNTAGLYTFEQRCVLVVPGRPSSFVEYYFVFNDEEEWLQRWPVFADAYRRQRVKPATLAAVA